MIFDRPIVYKLDEGGMWWSEVSDTRTGQWYSMCHLTHSDALAWANHVVTPTNPYRTQDVSRVAALDAALRMYGEGVALAVITERTGISYSGLMKAKKDRGIPDRPQRADGTNRSQA